MSLVCALVMSPLITKVQHTTQVPARSCPHVQLRSCGFANSWVVGVYTFPFLLDFDLTDLARFDLFLIGSTSAGLLGAVVLLTLLWSFHLNM